MLAGKYRLVRRLGEGGMGVVYEALHVRIQQRVAIKMLLPEVLDVPDVVSRFEREARAAGQLRSENTARVLDVDVSEAGLPYMVMEFLDGNDLGQLLEVRKQLPIDQAVDFVLQACNAMTEAHAAGIIHRDLKPSNLFVCGADDKLKVLDFGISKLENDTEARVTATQAVVGTPLYMSPEQVRSAKHVDNRSDIWSLGIILYELLAGRTPFEGSTTAAAAAICIDDPPPIAQFRQGVPQPLEAAILTALQKDPSKRYPNVQTLAASIYPFGSGRVRGPDTMPVAFPIPSQPSLPGTASGPYPARPAGMGDDHTLLPASSEPSIPPHRGTANATMPGWTTRSSTPGRKNRLLIAAASVVVVAGVIGAFALSKLLAHSPTPTPIASDTAATAATTTATTTTSTGAGTEAAPTAPASVAATSVSGEAAVPSASVTAHHTTPATGGWHPKHPPVSAPPTTNAPPTGTHAAPAPTRL